MITETKPVQNPIVSVDRASRKIAAFDGPTLVHEFTPYTNEESAIASMSIWLAFRKSPTSDWPPRVVYPKITKIRMSS